MKLGNVFVRLRDDDHREIPGPRGDFLAEREAIDVRQHDVQNDRTDPNLLIQDRHRSQAVSCFSRRESPQPQGETQQTPEIVVGFNDQNRVGADRHCWTAIPSWTGRCSPGAALKHRRRSAVPPRADVTLAAFHAALHGICGSHGRCVEGVH